MPAYTQDQIALGIIAEGLRARTGEGQLDHPVMSEKGIIIAIATGLVETNLKMYANHGDPESLNYPHDAISRDANSSGVFQQRHPWWGTVADRMSVGRSAAMFYGSLAKQRIGKQDYNTDATTPGLWAQMVQRSAYPNKYDQRMGEARAIYNRLAGGTSSPEPAQGWTGDPVWLKDVLEAAGLVCHVYPGAFNQGHGDMGRIWGVMAHHTGSFGETPRGIAEHPSLGLASQLYLSRDGEYTLCGVGVAWHGGAGSYPGINAVNSTLIGIEAANDGGGTPGKSHRASWSDKQYDAYVRGVAAILSKLGYGSDRVIGHKEWAGKAQGKWDPGAIDMNIFRSDVAALLTTSGEDWLNVPSNAEKLDAIYQELTKRFPSRSIYRTPGEGLVDTLAGFNLNQDAMLHQELIERLAIQYGDPDAVKRIFLVANGEGADPKDARAIAHAKDVIAKIPAEYQDNWKDA